MRRPSSLWRTTAGVGAAVALLALLPAPAAATGVVIPTPNPGTSNTIGGLAAFSPTDVWAVGTASSSSYSGCHGRTLTARFNGSAFVEVPAPATAICASVNGVSGRSTADIWAVGSTNNGRDTHVRHWNGGAWSTVPGATIPVPPSGGRSQRSTGLNGVAALSSTDVWAVGKAQFADFSRRGLVEHWNGTAWQLVSTPAPTSSLLNGVSALGPSDLWAVGAAGGSTLTMHWNGARWATVPSPNANAVNSLSGVAAVSASDVWAVGDAIRSSSDGVSTYKTLIMHWTGSAWTIVPSPNVGLGNNRLSAVAARSATDVWAVGEYDTTGDIPVQQTLALHWDGVRWTRVATANVGSGDNALTSVITPAGATGAWASGGSAAGTLVERLSS